MKNSATWRGVLLVLCLSPPKYNGTIKSGAFLMYPVNSFSQNFSNDLTKKHIFNEHSFLGFCAFEKEQ